MSQLLVDDIVDKDGGNSVGFSKGINVGASSTVTGNLNVTGVLTYEDVTNVDSVGLITARSGIKFGAAGVGGTIRANGDTTLAGVVTATSFSGDITGDITGSVTATSSPAITIRDGATEKGYIGFNGNDPFIGRKDGVGILFQDNKVRPVDGDDGSGSNNTVDLGEPTYKFKDLYLAGNANIAGAASTFSGNVTLNKSAGPTLELTTNTGSNDSSIHLHEGAVGSTSNGGAVIYSGANNKLSICCGTTLTTERIGIARDSGDVNIGTGVTISAAGICTVTTGTDLKGFKVESGDVSGGSLNGEFDFELKKGHIKTMTGSTAGTYFPDFKVSSSVSLNSVMVVGDTMTATLIVTASNTAHYCTAGIKIDDSTSNVTVEWIGSSAPSAGKGAGYDIYTFTIVKTAATPAYLVIVNATDAG